MTTLSGKQPVLTTEMGLTKVRCALLFFRFILYLAAFLGNDIHDLWVPIAGASALFLVFFIHLVNRLRLPGDKEGEQSIMPGPLVGPTETNAITATKDGIIMSDNPNINNKVLHINHGPSYHNTSSGMMNFGPVTVHQNFAAQQADAEAAQKEPQEREVEVIADDETIDIKALIEFAENLKPPGISRTKIDDILKDAHIKPCKTAKDGRNIRYLYPRKESQSAVSAYLANREKR